MGTIRANSVTGASGSGGVGVQGTNTNDNATAGDRGEMRGPITRVRSNALSLTSATVVNVCTTTSITLNEGDWDVRGYAVFQAANTTTISEVRASVSATSATEPAADTIGVPTSGEVSVIRNPNQTASGTSHITLTIPSYRVTVANAATRVLYLVASSTFGVSTMTVYGALEARRIR